ncbi:MAG: SMC family ATPase [Bacteroidota bacterium]|nr:SMC family ATPase [Bacteroidota bacterium]
MLPKYITITGFLSYKDAVEIDFEELMQDNLFGIFGNTGSGKSAIIDAITYALYEKCSKGDSKELVNLSSEELQVCFGFQGYELNSNEKCNYEIIRSIKRRKKKNEEFEPGTVKLYRFDNEGNKIAIYDHRKSVTNASILDILKLSYENFTKIIILPQGEFDKFLHLEGAKRAEMMAKIFDLDKYDVTPQAKARKLNLESSINLNKSLISKLGNLNEEEFETWEEELRLKNILLKSLNDKQTTLNQNFGKYTQEDLKYKSLLAAKLNYDEHSKYLTINEDKRANIERYEKLNAIFQVPLNDYNKAVKAYSEITIAAKGSQSSLDAFNEVIEKLNIEKPIIEGNYDKILSITQKNSQLNNLKKYLDLNTELQKANETADIKKKELNAIAKELEVNTNNRITHRLELENWHQQLIPNNIWEELVEYNSKLSTLAINIQNIENNVAKTTTKRIDEIKKLEQELQAVNIVFTEDVQIINTAINEKIQKCDNHILENKNQLRIHQIEEGLRQYRENLVDGEGCPLCGSLQHPGTLHEIADVKQEIKKCNEEIDKANKRRDKIKHINLISFKNSLENLDTEILVCQTHIKNHQSLFNTYLVDLPSEITILINQDFTELKNTRKEVENKIDKLNKSITDLTKSIETETDHQGKIKDNAAENNKLQTQLQTQCDGLTAQFNSYIQPSDLKRNPEEIDIEIQGNLEKILNSKTNYEKFNKKLKETTSDIDNVKGLLQGQTEQAKRAKNENQKYEAQLSKLLAENNIDSIADLQIILAVDDNRNAVKNSLIEYFEELNKQQIILAGINKWRESSDYQPELLISVQADISKNKEILDKENEESANLKNKITVFVKNKKESKNLNENIAKTSSQLAVVDSLLTTLKGGQLQTFISLYYLQKIITIANDRLIKLNVGLLLEFEGDKLKIKDLLNSGKLRPVSTLSGGQTFQISLCMALALSKIVQSQLGIVQQFFFLDEGFGTLDNSVLELIMNTLNDLRTEGRCVGIITHVESMKEQINVHLTVLRSTTGVSNIRYSWQTSDEELTQALALATTN